MLEMLDLSGNSFNASIPSTLNQCKKLKYLNMDNNKIYGHLPTDIGRLTMLQLLDLSNNNLTGSLPQSLFNISTLRLINLRNNQFGGQLPQDMCENAHSLTQISILNNYVSGIIPSSIGNCTSLTRLYLGANSFTEPPATPIIYALPKHLTKTLPFPLFQVNPLAFNVEVTRSERFEGAIRPEAADCCQRSPIRGKMETVFVVPVFHVGGSLVRNADGMLVYEGGSVEKFDRMDLDLVNFLDLEAEAIVIDEEESSSASTDDGGYESAEDELYRPPKFVSEDDDTDSEVEGSSRKCSQKSKGANPKHKGRKSVSNAGEKGKGVLRMKKDGKNKGKNKGCGKGAKKGATGAKVGPKPKAAMGGPSVNVEEGPADEGVSGHPDWKKNDKVRVRVKCKAADCPWLAHCSTLGCFQVKTYRSEHTCARDEGSGAADQHWLSRKIEKGHNYKTCKGAPANTNPRRSTRKKRREEPSTNTAPLATEISQFAPQVEVDDDVGTQDAGLSDTVNAALQPQVYTGLKYHDNLDLLCSVICLIVCIRHRSLWLHQAVLLRQSATKGSGLSNQFEGVHQGEPWHPRIKLVLIRLDPRNQQRNLPSKQLKAQWQAHLKKL
ncbi:hypothetical protein PIB30_065323 [Stylosanthes scabra]|uniref:WRKY domain-containing protein n=1 Tax=Stylosanthes scabra TaxID=79078 RepID=A0ABU6ZKR9_9FABA|nr:hypothetical protein [Stylosanthes scabra]